MGKGIEICEPQPNYVIIEQIYSGIPGMPSVANTIGPSLTKVMRRVLQTCDVQDVFFDGKRLPDNTPSTWQYIQNLIQPGHITTQPTGKREMLLVYAGYSNIIQPLPKIGNLLPESTTQPYNLGTTLSPLILGTDPIPNIKLYGNPRAEFVMVGGKSPATAVAIYKGKTNTLEMPPVSERERLIKELLSKK